MGNQTNIKRDLLVLLACLIVFEDTRSQPTPCTRLFIDEFVTVTETDPAGHVVYTGSATSGNLTTINLTLTTKGPNGVVGDTNLEPVADYIQIHQNLTAFYIVLNQPLDLEHFLENYNIVSSLLKTRITCHEGGTLRELNPKILITSVNEYYPAFVGEPFSVNVNEDTLPGTTVFSLHDKASDRDFDETHDDNIFKFGIAPHSNIKIDGFDYFNMPETQTGGIAVSKSLDYEMGFTSYMLNVSAQDYGNLVSWTTVTVNIMDADDQGPAFTIDGCFNPHTELCHEYTVTVSYDYKGALSVLPSQPEARDLDSLGSTIVYSIDIVTPASHRNDFDIDPSSGHLTLLKEITDVTDIYLIIKATEDNMINRNSTKAYISISINNPHAPDTGTGTGDSSPITMTIFGVVIGCIAAAVIIAAVIAFICVRKYKKKESVHPDDEKSEKSIEEVDTGSSSVESVSSRSDLVRNGQVVNYLNMPVDGRGNSLPPMSTSQAAANKGQKKKSKRRKRKDDEQIYDGTRTYPGKAEPEFYEDDGKKKIKRSERSYDTDDTKRRMIVPNDINGSQNHITKTVDAR